MEILPKIKRIFKEKYGKSVFPLLDKHDRDGLILGAGILLLIGYACFIFYNIFMETGISLFNTGLSAADQHSLENTRTIFGSLLALSVAVWLFFFNEFLSIFSDAKNQKYFRDIHKKLDIIIEKFELVEKNISFRTHSDIFMASRYREQKYGRGCYSGGFRTRPNPRKNKPRRGRSSRSRDSVRP